MTVDQFHLYSIIDITVEFQIYKGFNRFWTVDKYWLQNLALKDIILVIKKTKIKIQVYI